MIYTYHLMEKLQTLGRKSVEKNNKSEGKAEILKREKQIQLRQSEGIQISKKT